MNQGRPAGVAASESVTPRNTSTLRSEKSVTPSGEERNTAPVRIAEVRRPSVRDDGGAGEPEDVLRALLERVEPGWIRLVVQARAGDCVVLESSADLRSWQAQVAARADAKGKLYWMVPVESPTSWRWYRFRGTKCWSGSETE